MAFLVAPVATMPVVIKQIDEGNSTTFKYTVTPGNPTEITSVWKGNSRSSVDINATDIIFNDVAVEDTGNYTLRSENAAGSSTVDFFLEVLGEFVHEQ